MKCDKTNACSYNPKQHKPYQDRVRNYTRQPVREGDHGICPYRIDGNCTLELLQLKRLAELRKIITDYKVYAEKASKGILFYREETLHDNLIKYAGATIEKLTNPKTSVSNHYIFGIDIKKKNPTSDDLREYVKGFVNYHLDRIDKNFFYYAGLLECFDQIKITKLPLRITLWGDIDNFNDPSIYDWQSDDDLEFHTWFYKETEINGVKVCLHIRETKPVKNDGELNTER
jgi:hypothetical protein